MGADGDEYDAYFDELDITHDDWDTFDELCSAERSEGLQHNVPILPADILADTARTVSPTSESTEPSPGMGNTQFNGSVAAGSLKGLENSRSSLLHISTRSQPITRVRTLVGAGQAGDIARQQTPTTMENQSLIQLFRSRGKLSVTDLVSPQWCEVKFDYSLRGKRWRGVDMEDVVVSKHGKKIEVRKDIVQQSEATMKKGQAIHKKLEDQIPVKEVVVHTTTAEEKFALELLNMISNLKTLRTLGRCREMKIFGFIGNYYITGIIDEIQWKPLHRPPPPPFFTLPPKRARSVTSTPVKPKSKKARSHGDRDPNQLNLQAFLSPSRITPTKPAPPSNAAGCDDDPFVVNSPESSQEVLHHRPKSRSSRVGSSSDPRNVPKYRLYLNDTKTRYHPSLPKEDTAGRLQLMLYRKLLEPLVAHPDLDRSTLHNGTNGSASQSQSSQTMMQELPSSTVADPSPPYDFSGPKLSIDMDFSPQSSQSQATTDYYTAASTFSSPLRELSSVKSTSSPSLDIHVHQPFSPISRFSFDRLFTHLKLDPYRPFSEHFVETAIELVGEEVQDFDPQDEYEEEDSIDWMSTVLEDQGQSLRSPPQRRQKSSAPGISCLTEVVRCWWKAVERLNLASTPESGWTGYHEYGTFVRDVDAVEEDIVEDDMLSGPISQRLELIYHLRSGTEAQKKGGRRKKTKPEKLHGLPTEADQLEWAIRESLKDDVSRNQPMAPEPRHTNGLKTEPEDMAVILSQVQAQARVLSTASDLEWERAFGDGYLKDDDLLAVDLSDAAISRSSSGLPASPVESGAEGERRSESGVGILSVRLKEEGISPESENPLAVPPPDDNCGNDSDIDLATAVEQSLAGVTAPVSVEQGKGSEDILQAGEGGVAGMADGPLDGDGNWRQCRGSSSLAEKMPDKRSMKSIGKSNAFTPLESVSAKMDGKGNSEIIGITRFKFSRELLERHLASAFEFWEGTREPQGVELEDTWRCDQCEYKDDCEWRAMKAGEFAARKVTTVSQAHSG